MLLKMRFILPIILASFLTASPMLPDTYKLEDYKLIAAIPEQNIYMYAMDWKEEEVTHRGLYRDILLDLSGKQRIFSCWIVDTNPSFKPQLILKDMNKDGREDLIVITTKGTGTGIFIQEARVFDIDTYNDIYVMDPIEAIYQNVKTEMTKKNGVVAITITVKDSVFHITAKESSIGIWYDDISFGSTIKYAVINDKLVASLGAQVGFGINCGDIVMDYEFKNKRLEVNKITFKPYKDQNIFKY